MIRRYRFIATFLCTLGAAQPLVLAQAAGGRTSDDEAMAELTALLATQSTWSVSAALDASYGYRDNLLLSSAEEERSAFARGVAELMVLRFPTGPLEYTFFAQGERTRFLDGETVDHEARAWVQSELGYRLGDAVRLALPVTGYYSDQVFDVSDTEVERTIAELTVRGAMVAPMARWSLGRSWWVEAQATGERKRYDDGANDGTVGEGAVRLAWIRGERLEVRLGAARRWRNFDSRLRYSAVGREILDSELKIAEHELQLRFDVAWDEARRWRTSTRASELHYRDNGSGYFNYRERRIDHELEWAGERWRVRLGGSAARIDFGVQTVGLSLHPPARIKDEFTAELLVERTLSKRWTIFAGYEWERSRSNDLLASYRVNEGLLGVRRSWEK